MTFKGQWYRDKLSKKRQKGLRGYPVATVAYYGADDRSASKVSVGIIPQEDAEVSQLERWISETTDVRKDDTINEAIFRFIEQSGAKSVVGVDRIIGCPHEEGVDYPEGQGCPMCPYWAGRDRWSGAKK
jgi:hypothetical protein